MVGASVGNLSVDGVAPWGRLKSKPQRYELHKMCCIFSIPDGWPQSVGQHTTMGAKILYRHTERPPKESTLLVLHQLLYVVLDRTRWHVVGQKYLILAVHTGGKRSTITQRQSYNMGIRINRTSGRSWVCKSQAHSMALLLADLNESKVT